MFICLGDGYAKWHTRCKYIRLLSQTFLVYSNELNDVDQTTDKYTSIDLVYMSFHVPTNS